MKTVVNIIMMGCLLSFGFKARAQTYTLEEVLDSIDSRNPGLQQFSEQMRSSYALGESAKAWKAPSIGLGLSEFPYGNESGMKGGMKPRKMEMVRLQQMFPNFGEQRATRKYYRSFAVQYKLDRATLQNRLYAQAGQAYYSAFIILKKITVLKEQKQKLQLLIKIAEERIPYSKATLPDVYKAKAKWSDLQAEGVQLKSQLEEAYVTLNRLMDRPLHSLLNIDTSQRVLSESFNIPVIDSAYILNNRSDIKHTSAMIRTIQLKGKMIAQKADPTFGISWDNMRMQGDSYMFGVMAMVSIPIAPWFSKGYKSRQRAVNFKVQAMKKMRENQVFKALGNIRKEWVKLKYAKQNLHFFKTVTIPAYLKTYRAYLNAFSENTGNIYQTLMAWNDLTTKKMEYYDKLQKVLQIRIRLETALQRRIKR